MTQKAIEIKLQNGLEARPVAVLVQVASKYDSTIYIEVEGNAFSKEGRRMLEDLEEFCDRLKVVGHYASEL